MEEAKTDLRVQNQPQVAAIGVCRKKKVSNVKNMSVSYMHTHLSLGGVRASLGPRLLSSLESLGPRLG